MEKETSMEHYQHIIIGFGKAGKTLAAHLSKKGESVALIEKNKDNYGGTCINVACIPTKVLVHSAQALKELDYDFEQKKEYYKMAIHQKNEIIALLRNKNEEKLVNAKVEIINALGSFVDEHTIECDFGDHQEQIKGDKIYINTGSTPFIPDIKGIKESKYVYDSEQLMELETLPEHLVVLGAGYIGLEFANMYHNFGSKVTVVNFDDSFMPKEDKEIAEMVLKHLQEIGIEFMFNTSINEVTEKENGLECVLNTDKKLVCDALLVATGRRPNIEKLKVENAVIELTDKKAIKVNEQLVTNKDHIYAMGDVVGDLQFTYISLDDYRILVDESRTNQNRGNVPYTVFLDPPLSRVGQTQEEITGEVKVGKLMVGAIPKAHILRNKVGLFKVFIDAESDLILGAHFYGPDSFEMINLIKLAMDQKIKHQVLRDNIYTHPSMTEALNDLLSSVE